MSVKAFRWAKEQTGLTPSEKFVLIMLGDFYNEDWSRAWPSRARLATVTELSDATVKRVLRELEHSRGVIATEYWQLNEGGAMLNNRYLLPKYRPEVRPAGTQPVLATAGWDQEAPDDYRRLADTNFAIEVTALDPKPFEVGSW